MLGSYLCDSRVQRTDLPELNVTDSARVREFLCDVKPDVVLHFAAATDVDACELDPKLAEHVNVEGTRNVAEACAQIDCEILYMSTSSVFGGEKDEPYDEMDTPRPVSVYGRSKLEGEAVVRRLVRRHYIVRSGWLMGGGPDTDKKFVGKMLELMDTREEIEVVNDKFGSPTYTADLVEAILALIETGQYGLYHIANAGCCTRYDCAVEIARALGKEVRIKAVSSDAFPLPAPRPRMEALRSVRLERIGIRPLRPWQEALRAYLHEWNS